MVSVTDSDSEMTLDSAIILNDFRATRSSGSASIISRVHTLDKVPRPNETQPIRGTGYVHLDSRDLFFDPLLIYAKA